MSGGYAVLVSVRIFLWVLCCCLGPCLFIVNRVAFPLSLLGSVHLAELLGVLLCLWGGFYCVFLFFYFSCINCFF